MEALGQHILVELYGCPPSLLDDTAAIERGMVQAARDAGATIINTTFHHFSPSGVSGVVVIKESHLSIHTWPEHGFAAVDLFTCGQGLDPWASYRSLKVSLQAEHGTTLEMPRGQLNLLGKEPTLVRRPEHMPHPPRFSRRLRNVWLTDRHHDVAFSLRHGGELYRKQTIHQKVQVLDTHGYGKALVLDDSVTCTEGDEYVYHEMIVHVPALTHPCLRRALVIGGGDGGAARELLRHRSLEEAVVVEIDEAVVEASRKYLPTMSAALDDPRVTLLIRDGASYVQDSPRDAFDLVIVDVADTDDAIDRSGPGQGLFTTEFCTSVHSCLKTDGVLALQSGPPTLHSRAFADTHSRLRAVFEGDRVHAYLALIPTYATGTVGFFCASKGPAHPLGDLDDNGATAFAKKHGLRYYNPDIHRAAFALPTFVRNLLNETR